MMPSKRKYCPFCGKLLVTKPEGEVLREYCPDCERFFYNNPLPVVSSIVEVDRKVLLVKRKLDPGKGEWCLPMGFAESGETIEAATLRELLEEAGLHGKIIAMVDVVSGYSKMYGDLLFITFEAEQIGGKIKAGDDALEVGFFPLDNLPKMAFASNTKAISEYIRSKQDYWAIISLIQIILCEFSPISVLVPTSAARKQRCLNRWKASWVNQGSGPRSRLPMGSMGNPPW